MRSRMMTLSGWGRSSRADSPVWRPERLSTLRRMMSDSADSGMTILPRGAGRSYGDQALNGEGDLLLTSRMDRILAFDQEAGLLTCEAGVSFADLCQLLLPAGFLFPVTPGTALVTVGGAIANDVHGKNHQAEGSFGDHVEEISLMLADGSVVSCSETENAELFQATIGGCGLTGIILSARFRLMRVPSGRLQVKERRIAGLDEFISALERNNAADWPFSVGWIDGLAKGGHLGRGILEEACFCGSGQGTSLPPALKPGRKVPFDLPSAVLNPLSIALFNRLYQARVSRKGREKTRDALEFFYPLDGLQDWNRIYGRGGFYQFQAVIPSGESARQGIRQLMQAITEARAASFLSVIKAMGREGRGMLSFPMPGITLALDFPAGRGKQECQTLLNRLEAITLDHGGRIYLAKDALLSREGLEKMYPRLEAFRDVRRQVDPKGRFASDMSRRLGL